MATKTGPDLTFATSVFGRLRDDTCIIRRDAGHPNDVNDDTFDRTTGLITPGAAKIVIYTGACMFRPQLSSEPRYARDGENVEGKRYYDFGFPLSLVTVVLGDEIQITSSRRDPGAIGKVFLVRDFVTRTMAIHRRIIAELREPV